ncbi:MAG: efflux RND transporter periplasmic adaptor subunit [Deltaproteobacteria bacterium]|nr:efflux RND transporter periplasmic adaptor subunit [Deltaproteobacteria bacterium]MBZ0219119.1 efflux RND transporter periplasmic adaptor subunit [Deltaproteobacteria bacterium]
MSFRLRFFVITAAVAVFSLQGCSGKEAPQGQARNGPQKEAAAIKISVGTIEARTVERKVETTGTLSGWDETVVSAESPGKVVEIKADLGDRVKKGDILAVLDRTESALLLDQARAAHQTSLKALLREQARLDEARTNHGRYDELFKREMVSASQYDDMKTRLEVAAAQFHQAEAASEEASARLRLAEKRLADTAIRSQMDGEVAKRAISEGEYINDKAETFTIVSTATLKFRGTVSETSVPMVRPGQAVRITVEAYRDRAFDGKITRVSPSVDSKTRTLEVEASVPNTGGELKPGFFAKGVIATNRESGVAFAPEVAVYSFIGINKVFLVEEDGTVRERAVTIGAKDGGMVEIIGQDIAPGRKVATSNLAGLFDGAKVKVED